MRPSSTPAAQTSTPIAPAPSPAAGVAAAGAAFRRARAGEGADRRRQPGETGLDNLDPRVHISTNHQFVQIAIFDPLVRSHGSDFDPAAAESWEISPDGMTYTFHLRDAKWSRRQAGGRRRLRLRLPAPVRQLRLQPDLRHHRERRRPSARAPRPARGARRHGARRQDRRHHAERPRALLPRPRLLGAAAPGRADLVEKIRRRLRRRRRQPCHQRPVPARRAGSTRTRSC